MIVGRRVNTFVGTTMSDGVIDSAQGLLDGSSGATLLPVLLSLRLSLILFDSPLKALDLAKPDELDPEFESPAMPELVLELILDVSMVKPGLGDRLREAVSSSTHPAGVGGTGPRFDKGARLRRTGGEFT